MQSPIPPSGAIINKAQFLLRVLEVQVNAVTEVISSLAANGQQSHRIFANACTWAAECARLEMPSAATPKSCSSLLHTLLSLNQFQRLGSLRRSSFSTSFLKAIMHSLLSFACRQIQFRNSTRKPSPHIFRPVYQKQTLQS